MKSSLPIRKTRTPSAHAHSQKQAHSVLGGCAVRRSCPDTGACAQMLRRSRPTPPYLMSAEVRAAIAQAGQLALHPVVFCRPHDCFLRTHAPRLRVGGVRSGPHRPPLCPARHAYSLSTRGPSPLLGSGGPQPRAVTCRRASPAAAPLLPQFRVLEDTRFAAVRATHMLEQCDPSRGGGVGAGQSWPAGSPGGRRLFWCSSPGLCGPGSWGAVFN